MRIRSYLNPFSWSERTIKIVFAVFFALAIPSYIIVGLQPTNDTKALSYDRLFIESINLNTPTEKLELKEGELVAPADIAGSFSKNENKILLIGHSSTVFENLKKVQINDKIEYNNKEYLITELSTVPKSKISMKKILAKTDKETIVLMTCAGSPLTKTDYTHRLIVTAELRE